VENIRDKLAENIHEMWAVTKIETGYSKSYYFKLKSKLNKTTFYKNDFRWCFGERRDDQLMSHPCLTQFQNLPVTEKRYNIQLALQTLR